MDIDVGNPSYKDPGLTLGGNPSNVSSEKVQTNPGSTIQNQPTKDVVSPSLSTVVQTSAGVDRPVLVEQRTTVASFSEGFDQIQKSLNLPKAEDLYKLLSPETQKLFQQLFDEGANPKQFLEMLSKMLPFGLMLLNGMEPRENEQKELQATLAKWMSELGSQLQQHGKLTPADKELLRLLSDQITGQKGLSDLSKTLAGGAQGLSQGAGKEMAQAAMKSLEQLLSGSPSNLVSGGLVNVKGEQGLLKSLSELNLLPSSQLGSESLPLKMLVQAREQLQGMLQSSLSSGEGKSMASLSNLLGTLQAFSPDAQRQVAQVMIGSQALFSTATSQGILGIHSQQLAQGVANRVVNWSQNMGVIPGTALKAGSEYLSRVFGEALLGGAIFGRMIVDRGEGRGASDDSLHLGQAHMRAARELGVNDLVPINLLAHFVPFFDLGEDRSRAQKEASDALMQLVRILLKLAFMLSALYVGGKKIGEKGMNLMMRENTEYLAMTLDDLIFSLKKINEIFGVKVDSPLAHVLGAKKALLDRNYSEFWALTLSFLSDENDLKAFLEEKDQLDSLYETIKTLFKDSDLKHFSIGMG